MLICMQKKSTSFLTFFLRLQKIPNLIFWVIWTCLAFSLLVLCNIMWRNLWCLSTGKKINFILHVFLQILQTCYFGYFGHAWVCTPKNGIIDLQKTLMFICMPKTNFINYFFLEILDFKESYNLIGEHRFGL